MRCPKCEKLISPSAFSDNFGYGQLLWFLDLYDVAIDHRFACNHCNARLKLNANIFFIYHILTVFLAIYIFAIFVNAVFIFIPVWKWRYVVFSLFALCCLFFAITIQRYYSSPMGVQILIPFFFCKAYLDEEESVPSKTAV